MLGVIDEEGKAAHRKRTLRRYRTAKRHIWKRRSYCVGSVAFARLCVGSAMIDIKNQVEVESSQGGYYKLQSGTEIESFHRTEKQTKNSERAPKEKAPK